MNFFVDFIAQSFVCQAKSVRSMLGKRRDMVPYGPVVRIPGFTKNGNSVGRAVVSHPEGEQFDSD